MKRRRWISSATVLTLVIGLMAAILHFSRAPKASKQEVPVTITNETESLQVVSSTIEKNRLILTIKNAGDRPIIAYHFDLKAKEGLTGDSTMMGELMPGAQFSTLIPLSQLEQGAKTGLYKLNIAMAVFENGDAEGNWTHAQNYRNKLVGAALVAPQLREKIARVNASDISTVERLSGDLKTLLTPPGKMIKWQQIGYEGAVIQASAQAEYILRQRPSPDKIAQRVAELRKSVDRQAALGRAITEGGQSQ